MCGQCGAGLLLQSETVAGIYVEGIRELAVVTSPQNNSGSSNPTSLTSLAPACLSLSRSLARPPQTRTGAACSMNSSNHFACSRRGIFAVVHIRPVSAHGVRSRFRSSRSTSSDTSSARPFAMRHVASLPWPGATHPGFATPVAGLLSLP
jgi:hypothetical protein